jgi:hypothetical protein
MAEIVLMPAQGPIRGNYYHYFERGFSRCGLEVRRDDSQPVLPGAVFANDFLIGDKRVRCWYDWSDFAIFIDPGDGNLYFKIELRKTDVTDKRLPIGQICSGLLLQNLGRLRVNEQAHAYTRDIYASMRVTNFDKRLRLIREVRNRAKWNACTMLASRKNRPDVPRDIVNHKLPVMDNYHEHCRSKINFAVAGIGEKTWRHMEIMAIGAFMLMFETDRAGWDGYPGEMLPEDYSNFEERVDYYLSHDKERIEMAMACRNYWDRHLSPVALARYVLSKVKETL